MMPLPFIVTTLGRGVMFLPFVAMMAFGFMVGGVLETRGEVISR
jgi:hypothetical protein